MSAASVVVIIIIIIIIRFVKRQNVKRLPWHHLVNAYEGKAGMVLFAGKTVWSMSERFDSMRAY